MNVCSCLFFYLIVTKGSRTLARSQRKGELFLALLYKRSQVDTLIYFLLALQKLWKKEDRGKSSFSVD